MKHSRNALIKKRFSGNDRANEWFIANAEQKGGNFTGYPGSNSGLFTIVNYSPAIVTEGTQFTLNFTLNVSSIINYAYFYSSTQVTVPLNNVVYPIRGQIFSLPSQQLPFGTWVLFLIDTGGNSISTQGYINCQLNSTISPITVTCANTFTPILTLSTYKQIQNVQYALQTPPFTTIPLYIVNTLGNILTLSDVNLNVGNYKIQFLDTFNRNSYSSNSTTAVLARITSFPTNATGGEIFNAAIGISDVITINSAYWSSDQSPFTHYPSSAEFPVTTDMLQFGPSTLPSGNYYINVVDEFSNVITSETKLTVAFQITTITPTIATPNEAITPIAYVSMPGRTVASAYYSNGIHTYALSGITVTQSVVTFTGLSIPLAGSYNLYLVDSAGNVIVSPQQLVVQVAQIVAAAPQTPLKSQTALRVSAQLSKSVTVVQATLKSVNPSGHNYVLGGTPITGSSVEFASISGGVYSAKYNLELVDGGGNVFSTANPFVYAGFSIVDVSPSRAMENVPFTPTITVSDASLAITEVYYKNIALSSETRVSGVVVSNTTVTTQPLSLPIGVYQFYLLTVDGFVESSKTVTVQTNDFNIVEYTPGTATTGTAFTPTAVVNTVTTISGGYFLCSGGTTPVKYNLAGSFPMIGSFFTFGSMKINTSGSAVLVLVDNNGGIAQASTTTTVTNIITSVAPLRVPQYTPVKLTVTSSASLSVVGASLAAPSGSSSPVPVYGTPYSGTSKVLFCQFMDNLNLTRFLHLLDVSGSDLFSFAFPVYNYPVTSSPDGIVAYPPLPGGFPYTSNLFVGDLPLLFNNQISSISFAPPYVCRVRVSFTPTCHMYWGIQTSYNSDQTQSEALPSSGIYINNVNTNANVNGTDVSIPGFIIPVNNQDVTFYEDENNQFSVRWESSDLIPITPSPFSTTGRRYFALSVTGQNAYDNATITLLTPI